MYSDTEQILNKLANRFGKITCERRPMFTEKALNRSSVDSRDLDLGIKFYNLEVYAAEKYPNHLNIDLCF